MPSKSESNATPSPPHAPPELPSPNAEAPDQALSRRGFFRCLSLRGMQKAQTLGERMLNGNTPLGRVLRDTVQSTADNTKDSSQPQSQPSPIAPEGATPDADTGAASDVAARSEAANALGDTRSTAKRPPPDGAVSRS